MISAIVLAAGRSQRMGSLKPLLEVDGKTILRRIIDLHRCAGVEDIVVVTGFQAADVEDEVKRAGARTVRNTMYDEGMFVSVRTGIRSLAKGTRAFFMHPADVPFVQAGTLGLLLKGFREDDRTICIPCHQGRGGHPPLIGTDHVYGISTWSGENGLGGYLREHRAETARIETRDPFVCLDLDTPEDLADVLNLLHLP
ncbi:MAG: NTP transferase domain-containing protein [Desulfovibrionales bacterium]